MERSNALTFLRAAVSGKKAEKFTMKLPKNRGKANSTCVVNQRERGRDSLADVDHFLMVGIALGPYLCFGGLRYL